MKHTIPRRLVIILSFIIVLSSCKKSVDPVTTIPVQEMEVTDLGNRELRYNTGSVVLDLNKDNKIDLVFGVLLVGDPIYMEDKQQFTVVSGIDSKLPVNESEQAPALNRDDTVFLENFRGYNWFEISSITLIERIQNAAGVITWLGNWKEVSRSYLPVQVVKNNQRFNGWVEISADISQERLILHRAAISKKAETNIHIQ